MRTNSSITNPAIYFEYRLQGSNKFYMVGSDKEADSSTGKKMASRLKLRKKKYHPPLQEYSNQPNIECNKTTEEHKTSKIQTYAQIASSTQIFEENEIFTKAIENAKKHNIKMKAGRQDRGYGNCAFEAVINNINDRDCFSDKLLQSPNWYRRSWMDQMMMRIIMGICLWNPGYTENQIREGFAKLQETGIYEIDFFGDMMIAGIACGTRKRILIFNTSENLVHDPISVVDPTHYDERINIDNETPVVVAYNNYHYENLLPVDEQDRQQTIKLVDSYIKDRYNVEYGFTKKDIKYLTSPSQGKERQERKVVHQVLIARSPTSTIRKQHQDELKVDSNHCYNFVKPENLNKFESEGLEEPEKQSWTIVLNKNQKRKLENSQKHQQKTTCQTKIKKKCEEKLKTNNQENVLKIEADKKKQSEVKLKTNNPVVEKECFKWGNVMFEEMENNKIKCGFCQSQCLRLISHLNGSPKCRHGIKMAGLKLYYNKYSQRKRKKKSEQKKKAEDPEEFKKNHDDRVKKSKQKKKTEDPEEFKKIQNDRVKKSEQKKKAEDPEEFKKNQNDRIKKSEQIKKVEDHERYIEDLKGRVRKSRNMVTADDRLMKFRKKIQYGPIFICTCCHQKLFLNQVDEFTEKLKEEIDKIDQDIRAESIKSEIQVDLGRNELEVEIKCTYICTSF